MKEKLDVNAALFMRIFMESCQEGKTAVDKCALTTVTPAAMQSYNRKKEKKRVLTDAGILAPRDPR